MSSRRQSCSALAMARPSSRNRSSTLVLPAQRHTERWARLSMHFRYHHQRATPLNCSRKSRCAPQPLAQNPCVQCTTHRSLYSCCPPTQF